MPEKTSWNIHPARHWISLLIMLLTTIATAQQRDFYGNQLGQDMCRTMSYTPDEQVN